MNEDGLSKTRKDQIGLAGQVFAMQPEPVAHAVRRPADEHLGCRVN
jgi:hypothetical protein